jgi:hypothetical protein
MRLPSWRFLGVLAAVFLLFVVGTMHSTGVSAHVASQAPAVSAAVPPVIASTVAAAPNGPTDQWTPVDSCWRFDSWCAYCTNHPDAANCLAYPPPHESGAAAP